MIQLSFNCRMCYVRLLRVHVDTDFRGNCKVDESAIHSICILYLFHITDEAFAIHVCTNKHRLIFCSLEIFISNYMHSYNYT